MTKTNAALSLELRSAALDYIRSGKNQSQPDSQFAAWLNRAAVGHRFGLQTVIISDLVAANLITKTSGIAKVNGRNANFTFYKAI